MNGTLTIMVTVMIMSEENICMADQSKLPQLFQQPIQSGIKSPSTLLSKALTCQSYSDGVLRSSDGTYFRSHKIILALGSAVFHAMFEDRKRGNIKTKRLRGHNEARECVVEMADCSDTS